MWFRIADNGTNLTYYISGDGQNFIEIFTEARGAFFTTGPDEIGFCVDVNNTDFEAGINLVHRLEE